MKRSKILILPLYLMFLISLTACERSNTVCTEEAGTPKPTLELADLLMTPVPDSASPPVTVEIKGKMMEVDKVVDYPICNDDWSGVVYVACDAQVAEAALDADENPLFFEGCELNIEPDTVVYVAAHNDAPYYKGCSCHTGEDPIP